ncbi:C25 family cysteine peptidase [Hymenobacter sp. ASUV-10]|uniref:C25 family cysteine peptidase n=1 Tax=Hymenobacter aranciens TaxID=3063996 RepID=A0ABT9BF18_9BACT|nr:C25 family cysteine peptidase [Hymenobacter sp. ASUV-10]MDO7876248.1 C25 family cysteine peptidase [Hymenobacter sp. ASUV-10]
MTKYYRQTGLGLMLAFLLALAGGQSAQAQQLVYGNEWIVPGQQYFKLKLPRTGLYKIDYQYLTAAGIAGVAPQNLQLWRRGRELARYVGGNAQVLDATTYIEFFGQRNDGQLDRDFYKSPNDLANPLYSYYTDTASYFITWGVGAASRPGRAMTEPVAAPGALHPHRLYNTARLIKTGYSDGQSNEEDKYNYTPWFDKAEGYISGYVGVLTPAQGISGPLSNNYYDVATDSLMASVPLTSGPFRVQVNLIGSSMTAHRTEISVVEPGGTIRVLDTINYRNYDKVRRTFAIRRSDINSTTNPNTNAKITIRFRVYDPSLAGLPYDRFRIAYYRITVPQTNRWFPNKRHVLFQNDSLLAGTATYEVDSIPAAVHGYDVTDPYNVQRITGTAGSTARSKVFVFPSATSQQTRWLLLSGDRPYVPQPAQRVTFRTFNPSQPNYIIVTSRLLQAPAANVPNAAQAYADYRASAAGGGHNVLMVNSEDLYDQFHYGEKSALAVRRFAKLIMDNAGGQQKNLLLLGNGVIYSVNVYNRLTYRNEFYRNIPGNATYARDLVPVSGRSTSDAFFTADWQNDDYVARMHTGRVPATNPQEVMNYLRKVQQHDSLGMEPWRKNVLNLVGGQTAGETGIFNEYMTGYKKRIERPLWGGRVVKTIQRTAPQTTSVNIQNELNAGLSLINYFGHGSNTTFGLHIGTPDVVMNNYSNAGRYPIMFFNGCSSTYTAAGTNSSDNTIFDKDYRTFAELWLLSANKGAIGLLGQSGFSYPGPLDTAQDTVFSLLLNNNAWYGKPVAQVYAEAVRRLQRTQLFQPVDGRAVGPEQLMCTMWLGDPVISLYAPARPDFQTSSAALSIVPQAGQPPVSASSNRFVLNIGVKNPGKITRDTLEVRVRRVPGMGSPIDTVFKFRQSWLPDTIYTAVLRNPAGVNVFGSNRFEVMLDPANRVPELDENNNTGELLFTFLKPGVTALSPAEFAIVGSQRPHLVAQTNDPSGTQRVYEYEVDTTAAFTSPAPIRQTATVTATLTPDWQPTLPAIAGRDSVVWYWRVRFQTPAANETAEWTVSSFRIIQNSAGGWSQSHYAQLQRNQRQGVEIAAPTGRWRFVDEFQALTLRTQGAPTRSATFTTGTGLGIIANISTPPSVLDCGASAPNLLLAIYDQHTLQPKRVNSTSYLTCGQAPQQFYTFATDPAPRVPSDTLNNINNSGARQSDLQSLLSQVTEGDYVALISMNRVRWADPSLAGVKNTLATLLGSTLVNQLQNGDPLAVLSRKYNAGGQMVRELGPDLRNGNIPRANQTITIVDTLSTPSFRGKITSTRIGPAQNWETLHHWIKKESTTSSYKLRVIGIDTLGNSTVLQSSVPSSRYPLSNISARTYPYLELELELQDSTNRMAPQLKEWFITYRGVPEGVVRRDLVAATNYDAARLATMAADSGYIRFPVAFENVTSLDFSPGLLAKVDVRDASGNGNTVLVTIPGQLKGDATTTFNVKVPMIGRFGTFNTRVTVNPQPKPQPELYYFNNELALDAFTVIDRNLPPTLDVAFDGRRIMSGELVSPRPVISIQMNDEDRLRHISNVSYFTVTLQRAGQPATIVDLRSSAVRFTTDTTKGSVARLEYQPGLSAPMPDGVYTLRVQGRDPSNATAGIAGNGDAQDYEVKFEVVNASTITNVFPYPNPVTSKAKFVFTVTGQELPRNMKIQIMTIAGRVVREIFMSELGPLHIGNNITEYAWDGTDEYGDRLANGTYLYRVSLDDPQDQFSQRRTVADKAFKNDWGKLVLMR